MAEMKKIAYVDNVEKKDHEKWYPNRAIDNPPKPYRALFASPPNGGKTSTILAMILAANPIFDKIFIIHGSTFDNNALPDDELTNKNILLPEDTKIPEYKGIKFSGILRYFPSPTYFSDKSMKGTKKLLIIDDVDVKSYIKKYPYRQSRVNKLFSYSSTHNNLTLMISCQDLTSSMTPGIYRMINFATIFKFRDANQISLLGRNLGENKKTMEALMELLKNPHDSFTLDATTGTPYPYRYNLLNPIKLD